MAVVHVKNIHNHKIKTSFRNEPLPPYFDGYVDTDTSEIVDPVSNVDEFLGSVKGDLDAKVGNMLEMINKNQSELSEKSSQLDDFLDRCQADFDESKTSVTEVLNSLIETINKNNEKILGYLFQSSQFGGNKELIVNNGTEISTDTVKFIKKVKYDVTYSISRSYTLEAYLDYLGSDWKPHSGYLVVEPDGWTCPKYCGVDNKTFTTTQGFPFNGKITIETNPLGEGIPLVLDCSSCSGNKINVSVSYDGLTKDTNNNYFGKNVYEDIGSKKIISYNNGKAERLEANCRFNKSYRMSYKITATLMSE